MEETGKRTLFMSPTSFVAEIVLVFMGLAGVSVIGVNVGYASILPSLFIGYGLVVGIVSTLMCVIGLYVLLYRDYRGLKFYLTTLMFFVLIELLALVYLHIFATNGNRGDEEKGAIIALNVAFGLMLSTFVALCVHARQKGSTIEMVKL